jgi:hypothetical protein
MTRTEEYGADQRDPFFVSLVVDRHNKCGKCERQRKASNLGQTEQQQALLLLLLLRQRWPVGLLGRQTSYDRLYSAASTNYTLLLLPPPSAAADAKGNKAISRACWNSNGCLDRTTKQNCTHEHCHCCSLEENDVSRGTTSIPVSQLQNRDAFPTTHTPIVIGV